jgi:hypothetical protein
LSRPASVRLAAVLVFLCSPLQAQTVSPAGPKEAEFKKLAQKVVDDRKNGIDETPAEEAALAILDEIVLSELNSSDAPQLETLNQKLASFVTRQPPAGQAYSVVRLGGPATAYALGANFGSSGPSAVRLYAREAGQVHLLARIDHATRPDFFDDYLELVPFSAQDAVFLTVTGRTDELQTGMFIAWRWSNGRLSKLWSSDLVPRSNYEFGPEGLRLTYCSDPDPDAPSNCHRMIRERYVWAEGAWKLAEHANLSAPPR